LSPDTVTVPDTGTGLLAIRAYIILEDAPLVPLVPLVPAVPEITILAVVQLIVVVVSVAGAVIGTVAAYKI
jgi:hypothetical protein